MKNLFIVIIVFFTLHLKAMELFLEDPLQAQQLIPIAESSLIQQCIKAIFKDKNGFDSLKPSMHIIYSNPRVCQMLIMPVAKTQLMKDVSALIRNVCLNSYPTIALDIICDQNLSFSKKLIFLKVLKKNCVHRSRNKTILIDILILYLKRSCNEEHCKKYGVFLPINVYGTQWYLIEHLFPYNISSKVIKFVAQYRKPDPVMLESLLTDCLFRLRYTDAECELKKVKHLVFAQDSKTFERALGTATLYVATQQGLNNKISRFFSRVVELIQQRIKNG